MSKIRYLYFFNVHVFGLKESALEKQLSTKCTINVVM